MGKITKVLGWSFGILFILFGLLLVFGNLIVGITVMIIGALVCYVGSRSGRQTASYTGSRTTGRTTDLGRRRAQRAWWHIDTTGGHDEKPR